MAISLLDQIACVQRELVFRRRLYPRWVAKTGKSGNAMTQAKADREIATMEAVLATLEGLVEKERLCDDQQD